MCGRVTLEFDLQLLRKILREALQVEQMSLDGYEPRYNISPGQPLVSVINDGHYNRAGFIKWGFIPHYAREPKEGYKHINTRSETIDSKPTFKDAFQHKRCLVIADSFYEWHKDSPSRTPYRIQLKKDPLMPMAGIWSRFVTKEGDVIYSCSIVTTAANDMIKPIHSRMPVILKGDAIHTWLNPMITSSHELKPLLTPYDTDLMTMYPVSKLVNNTKLDSPELIEPA